MYDSDFHSLSLYLIWHYLIHPGGRFCPSSAFSFLQLLFCHSVQNLQLCPHGLQVFLFYLSWAMILNLSSVSSQSVVGNSSQQTNTFHCRQGRWSWKDTFHLQVYTHAHRHPKVILTCVSNIKTLYWPFFVVAFEQFNPKDIKNRGWFIHIHSV